MFRFSHCEEVDLREPYARVLVFSVCAAVDTLYLLTRRQGSNRLRGIPLQERVFCVHTKPERKQRFHVGN
jgi:hypothetical protein